MRGKAFAKNLSKIKLMFWKHISDKCSQKTSTRFKCWVKCQKKVCFYWGKVFLLRLTDYANYKKIMQNRFVKPFQGAEAFRMYDLRRLPSSNLKYVLKSDGTLKALKRFTSSNDWKASKTLMWGIINMENNMIETETF